MSSLNHANEGQRDPTTPLFDEVGHPNSLSEQVTRYFGLGSDRIERILPGTPFQRDVMDCTAKDRQRAVGHAVFEIPKDVDNARLAAAWKETVHQTPAMRTCTYTSESGDVFQVVLRESFVFAWMYWTSPDLKQAVVQDEAAAAIAGPRCNRFVLLDNPDTKERLLIWTFNHALVDGAFQQRILERVLKAYKDAHDEHPRQLETPDSSQATPEEDPNPNTSKMLQIPQAADMERATQFWKEYFSGLDASVFPHLSSHLSVPSPDKQVEHRISYSSSIHQKWSSTTVCRAALAILLSRYTHSAEALFGVVTKQAPMFEEHQLMMDGPTRTVVPIRVICASGQSVSDVMATIDIHDDIMRQFVHAGLRNISSTGDDGSAACGFQTVLLVTDSDSNRDATWEILRKTEASENFIPCTNRALLLSCQLDSEGAKLVARYDQNVIDFHQTARFLGQLGCLIEKLQSSSNDLLLVGKVDMVTPEDRAQIEHWNSGPIHAQDTLIHSEMLKWASDFPNKTAIAAWDGEWTYAELDNVSSRLARHIKLIDLSNKEQAILPVYFEKSKWVVASMLAVLKAGYAFTLIDPSDPLARTSQVVEQTSATIALTSKRHCSTVKDIVGRCIVVDDDLIQSLTQTGDEQLPTLKSRDLAYAIFTSGSTGTPKGIMIEHQAFASCALKFGPAMDINKDTRTLQFGSHAFGACILEIMTTLIHGGCVCIPSDDDRMNNVPDFINRCKVNWAMLTPSYVSTFAPETFPRLQTLILVGEQMSASVNKTWAPRVGQLLNGYGQSESSSFCSVAKIDPNSSEPNNIGRTVGAHSWIIDPADPNCLAPIGAIGELVLESPGIARDYIVPPPADESPFITTAPAWYPSKELPDGTKFYRTGDLARYASDGSIVCLGRVDSQVKIRGQRVELGAVETCLRQQMPDDMAIVVEAIKTSALSSRATLIAFLISSSKSESDAHVLDQRASMEITSELEKLLPRHSIPSFYICMDDLPRTATGKVDRRRLRNMGSKLLGSQIQTAVHQSNRVSKPSAIDKNAKLDDIWIRSLNLEMDSANIGASFFELGGDSITAIKMVNMARSAGMELKVSDIYQNPTLDGLKALINSSSESYIPIPKSAHTGPVEQSYAQNRMWFLDQLEEGASWYLIPYAVRMRGQVDIDALSRALSALEERHETLRTTFENQDGVGVQIVHKKLSKGLKVIDLSDGEHDGYSEALYQAEATPFNLASEAGWRAWLIRMGEQDHVLSIVMHHIISDGWSIDVLRRELTQLYAAALQGQDPLSAVSPLPIQYRDFSIWQKQESQAVEHEKQLEYWKKQLADSTPAKIPTDYPRPDLLSGEAGVVPVTIDGELYQKLRDFCNKHNSTSFSVLLAAFRAAHYRLTGVDDAVIGTPIANRNRWELENMIGFFVNTQCMRIAVDDDDTFESLVKQVRSTTTAAFEHEDVPFERVVSALQPGSRDLSRTPLAQIMFALHSQKGIGRFELQGIESEPLPSKAYTRFDIEFHLLQEAGCLKGSCNFATDLFKPETVQNVVSVFFQILRHGLDQPHTSISVLPLTDGVEELRSMGLLKIKQEVEYPRDSSVVDVWRAQADKCPDSLAVVDSSQRLTYAELDRQSDLLADWLRRRNMAPETLVGVLAPRSCETVVAFLGILKANLAYLPLDVRSPTARMRDILSAVSGHTILLLGSDVTDPEFDLPDLEVVPFTKTLEECVTNGVDGHSQTDSLSPSATSLAYVLFTSGSTGKPKGVMIEHRVILRLVKSDIIPNFPSSARMAHMFNVAFDGATYEIWNMLLNGGTIVCIDYMTSLDGKALSAVFAQEQVNVAIMAPALLKMYLSDAREAIKNLDVVIAAGDRFDGQDAADALELARGQCLNAYGPTENGVFSTLHNVAANEYFHNGVPLGRPINNSGAFVMDPNQQLVGVGVMGELVVTGDGLARGYNDPKLDVNRFIHITIDGETVRAYRTGDRVRARIGDGIIEFFGRMDTQFKIRGNRIEAGEVEAAILSHQSVHDAAVVLREDEGQQPEMIGYVVADEDHSVEQEETGNQVEGWQDHFETGMYSDISTAVDQSAIGNDFKGWTSMYDGKEIDKGEMQEWLDDTIHTLHDGQVPSHVLEIGTGSGMILLNLNAALQSYVGLEPSKSATDFVNKAIESIPAYAQKAKVHVGTATDVNKLGDIRPDLVVFNSVVQYFPTPEYLAEVVDTLVRIPSVRHIFLGDIRSYAINRHFLAARALHTLGKNATKHNVRQKIAELEEREEEFLVEPAFFTTLQDRLPELIKHVEIIPKNMKATNELSAYRYAAVIHLHGDSGESTQPVYSIEKDQWIDFESSLINRNALLDHLRLSKDATTVAISNIPYDKTALERRIVESLDDEAQSNLDGAAWISAIRSEVDNSSSVSVPELFQLAKETGFRLEVSAARQWSQAGALDAVFHRYTSVEAASSSRTFIRFPNDNQLRSSSTLANRPLQRLQRRRAALQVRERLQSLVPSYMIPSSIVVLDKMPLNANGKVDRKELARRARILPKAQAAAPVPAFPISDIEIILCEEATEVFGMKVEIGDHFFKLGGHSLLATKLISRIDNRLKVRVTVKDVFDHPVFADLAAVIRQGLALLNSIDDGPDKQAWSSRVAPRNETEKMLCEEFAKVLGIQVGITDNFFDLGGHSLMATKLAVRIGQLLNTSILVKDIFDHPVIFQLAKKIESIQSQSSDEANHDIQTADYAPLQLLDLQDPKDFIEREIRPQLESSCGEIQDVYPSTQVQKAFLFDPTTGCPRKLVPFYLDFPRDADSATLVKACELWVQKLDIFRTVFLKASGELYQVVLEHLDLDIQTIETEQNVHTATSDYLDAQAQDAASLGHPLIRITIMKTAASVRVILRLSHALYDGLSFDYMVRGLHALYNGRALPPPTQFARYMQYNAYCRKDGYGFWRDVIQNSPMTVLTDHSIGNSQLESTDAKAVHLSEIVSVPLQAIRSSITTQAVVFNAACALVMSKEAASKDVVFGRIVSGRQGLPVAWQDIIGPCTNCVPVRAHIGVEGNQQQLLRDLQDQYLRSLPYETLGFDELKRNCTDWPEETTNYSVCVTYHNFEYHPESEVGEQRVEMGVLAKHVEIRKDEPLYDFAMAGEVEPDGINLKITVVAKTRLFTEARTRRILEDLCKTFQTLNSSL
ncbi:Enniatin synthase [Fusarium austroafricanum]|uniref:Enniatin synthase n=1 Tax=Fusarium austroafricanum TaxID=2364996 RepID=A0A8H4P601_9HYPO|nr:Enniatin synthase [Fusarium austroafricanum]